MTTFVALLSLATITAALVPRLVLRAGWPARAPRTAVLVWQLLSVTALIATTSAGIVLAVGSGQAAGWLAKILRACPHALRHAYGHPFGVIAGVAGLAAATGLILRSGIVAGSRAWSLHRWRSRHRQGLRLVGRRDQSLGAVVVDHSRPICYCLPGRPAHIVVSRGAVEQLAADSMQAVLAHERAHLAGRHFWATGFADLLDRAFPGVPVFRHGAAQVPRLLELRADEIAVSRTGRSAVAGAMIAVLDPEVPPAGAPTTDPGGVSERVERLVSPQRPPRLRFLAAGTAAVTAALPLMLLLGPAVALADGRTCPLVAVHND